MKGLAIISLLNTTTRNGELVVTSFKLLNLLGFGIGLLRMVIIMQTRVGFEQSTRQPLSGEDAKLTETLFARARRCTPPRITRVQMQYRRRRGITESTFFDDCCFTAMCECCVLAQMDRTEFNYQECEDCGKAFSSPV